MSTTTSFVAWICLGDFNVVRYATEKLGGDLSWTPAMDSFNACRFELEVDDLKSFGH